MGRVVLKYGTNSGTWDGLIGGLAHLTSRCDAGAGGDRGAAGVHRVRRGGGAFLLTYAERTGFRVDPGAQQAGAGGIGREIVQQGIRAVAQIGQEPVARAQHVRGPEEFRQLAVVGFRGGGPAEQQPGPLPHRPVRPVEQLREAVRGGPVPQVRAGAVAQVVVVTRAEQQPPPGLVCCLGGEPTATTASSSTTPRAVTRRCR